MNAYYIKVASLSSLPIQISLSLFLSTFLSFTLPFFFFSSTPSQAEPSRDQDHKFVSLSKEDLVLQRHRLKRLHTHSFFPFTS